MEPPSDVVIGLSGGVDSAMAAFFLKSMGLMLILLKEMKNNELR